MEYRSLEELMGEDPKPVTHGEILAIINMISKVQQVDADNMTAVIEILQGLSIRVAKLENKIK